ncbi:MAG TPA: Ig-like domain repeat protein [Terracidiphilus sp.]|jgi:hypothetical protein|nr:Ig-like domain repeat protein [Terracidiphilus sp.]
MRAPSVALLLGILLPATLSAQSQPKALVTRAIDEANLTVLHGTVSPLAQAGEDRGPVPDSHPAGRMLLMLNRPPEREAALVQFLRDVHTPGTASYHQWITPLQFGERFGAADADVEAVSQWLQSHGLEVKRVAKSRQFVEFAGTAGQVSAAFHTSIHQYGAEGQAEGAHYANATEVRIPAALAGLVRGVAPMNNFRAQPQLEIAGRALYSRRTGRATPLWTEPNPFGTNNADAYPVAPEDFATQYDLGPLYQAGINGTGQTIGIINESNIDLSLVQAYQSLFGVAGSLPQVVIDGDDPGPIGGVDTEAYLDVELSGAVAPKATVNLYIAGAGYLADPLELAAVRAVEDNQASVLSVSFGQCEQFLTEAGNQFWSQLWEQAAAQGQTVLVASGDTGPACYFFSPSVNGLASTPWNVAVGGTDFYYSDYATGGASAETLWNATNDANLGSLKAPLPEQGWSDAFGLDVIANGWERREIYGGGGGPSSCVTSGPNGCMAGYAKPTWQTGPGVPADEARELPDVSLFASNGANLSAIPICAYDGECASGTAENAEVLLTGGTSASAPAMAAIMALVNQKWGRQGQADNVLYALAQQKPSAFHDVTLGGNQTICDTSHWPDCAKQGNGHNGTPEYMAGPGYDMATGLGSVDANVLVSQWNAIAFKATQTSLQVSSTKVTHGTPLTLTATVSGTGAGTTPTGSVAILTSSTLTANESQTVLPLSAGSGSDGSASGSIDFLPGGQYELTAKYGGDNVYAGSTSSPVAVTIAQEPSVINFALSSLGRPVAIGGSVPYGQPLQLVVQPGAGSAMLTKPDAVATGTATFTLDSTTITVPLNVAGIATWIVPALTPGNHTASATYSGDASYGASSATAATFAVTLGQVTLNETGVGPYTYEVTQSGEEYPWRFMNTGSTLEVGVTARGAWTFAGNPAMVPLGTPAPTGTVNVCLTTYPGLFNECDPKYTVYSQTVKLAPVGGNNFEESAAIASFPSLADGMYYVTLVYSGDTVWGSEALLDSTAYDVQALPPLAATTTTLNITPANFSGSETATVTATIKGAGNGGVSPKGELDIFNNDLLLTYVPALPTASGDTSTVSFRVNPSWFLYNGANKLTAVYWGDLANGPSVSNEVDFTIAQTPGGDFAMAPQAAQVAVKSGATAKVTMNLASLNGLNGNVSLTCTPSSAQFSCSVSPGSVALNGTGTAAVTITATLPGGTASAKPLARWPLGVLAAGVLLGLARKRRMLRGMALAALAMAAIAAGGGCGGGSGNGGSGSNPPPANGTPAGVYSVLVTGTANQIVHNVKLTVVVQ